MVGIPDRLGNRQAGIWGLEIEIINGGTNADYLGILDISNKTKNST